MSEFVVLFANFLATVLWIALIGRVVISWLNIGPTSGFYPVAALIYQITEPILAPLRQVIPPLGMFDLTPMIALILLAVLRRVVFSLI